MQTSIPHQPVSPDDTAVPGEPRVPLVVDLDETLVAADSLIEGAVLLLKHQPLRALAMPAWLAAGKQRLKARIAERVTLDVALLPYRAEVLDYVRGARAQGRHIVLATAANERVAHQVAAHLGLFDEVLASDDTRNLAGERKRERLVEAFGERGFDYMGSARADVAVWRSARRAVVVGGGAALRDRARATALACEMLDVAEARPTDYLSALRLHHWLKNALLFVPLMAAHRIFEPALLAELVLAVLAFGLCASGVYLLNDLLDLEDDRHHPRKRNRPIPAGRIPARRVVLAMPVVLGAGLGLALALSVPFALVAGVYVALNLLYSLRLKSVPVLDVLVLAAFYALRIVAGSLVIGVWLSPWLLIFAMFVFLSLALVKRYAELMTMRAVEGAAAKARGYRLEDGELLATFGASAGYVAVLVLALYIDSGMSHGLYSRPAVLWGLCVLVLYWISYLWLTAHRRRMHDDPLVFAVRDPVSLVLLALMALVYLAAL
jgi:4-hydroxybenzoate polyprenyltransferase/phosphoserine phosphatase